MHHEFRVPKKGSMRDVTRLLRQEVFLWGRPVAVISLWFMIVNNQTQEAGVITGLGSLVRRDSDIYHEFLGSRGVVSVL